MADILQAVRAFAEANYELGGDVIVEAFTDDEILELVSDAKTPAQAVAIARDFCGLRQEQASNVYAQSGEHEAERAQAVANAEALR